MEAGTARQEETEHLQAERISIPADGRSGMEWAGRTSLIRWRIPGRLTMERQTMWKCPKCGRAFARQEQQHYCGKPNTVDEYVDSQEAAVQPRLREIRAILALPSRRRRSACCGSSFRQAIDGCTKWRATTRDLAK